MYIAIIYFFIVRELKFNKISIPKIIIRDKFDRLPTY